MHTIAILTPTWNRGSLLLGLYTSILQQSFNNFEWIIVDDFSTDDTEAIVANLLDKAPFPITYARYTNRVGKVRADNTLLDLKNSEFVVWCDSDDKLTPDALEKLVSSWKSIETEDSGCFIGVVSLCADTNGVIQSSGETSFNPFVSTWKDLGDRYNMLGDMCIMQKSSVIQDSRFPEHDLVISESGFWHQFMHMNVICIPDVLKIMRRDTPNRISGSTKMEFCRGKAYSIIYADSSSFVQKSLIEQLKLSSMYHRYCIHGDIGFRKRCRLFRGRKIITYYIGAAIGSIQALKDIIQRRVVKSHIVFEQGKSASLVIHRNFG
jgi:glycosyltransferase involved in cell wall biosynthesis